MDSIRQYVLSVICVVIICGVVQMLFASGSAAPLVKIICGLMVTITVLRPAIQDKLFTWDESFSLISSGGEIAVTDGKRAAEKTIAQLITDKTQTYILNKASELGADITVEVTLEQEYPMTPEYVTIKGMVSPYVKMQLAQCMHKELGIAEENQIWIS